MLSQWLGDGEAKMSKRIAVLTSGGDAAGMNAAIRAVARTAIAEGAEVFGVRNGFDGLLNGDFLPLTRRRVGGVLQHGGTFLGSARSTEFPTEAGQARALKQLADKGIEHLVVIGGNGSLAGGWSLAQRGIHVVGIPGTIDNDVYGTEMSLGVDTTLNIVLEAMDRIRTTASSHKRGFLIEVMGRDSGYLALMSGLAGGAEAVVIPEVPTTPAQVVEVIRKAYERKKRHAIIVVAEGAECNAARMTQYLAERPDEDPGFAMRTTILGHVQRGGTPTAQDRLLGAQFGAAAAQHLLRGDSCLVVGIRNGRIATTPLEEVATKHAVLDRALLELAQQLAL